LLIQCPTEILDVRKNFRKELEYGSHNLEYFEKRSNREYFGAGTDAYRSFTKNYVVF
jgi:hypothetical protein